MNTRHATNFANWSPLSFCFWFLLAPQRPTTRLTLFECSCVVYCCVWGRDQPSTASIRPLNSEQYCCVFVSLPPSTVDCCIPRSPHTLSISHRIDLKGCGANYFIRPPSHHIVCERAARTHHRPIVVLPWRLFHQPHGKIEGLDGFGGKGRHHPWC
jgi:hypothetical protein